MSKQDGKYVYDGLKLPVMTNRTEEESNLEDVIYAIYLLGLAGRRKRVSWLVKPLSWEEIEDNRMGPTTLPPTT